MYCLIFFFNFQALHSLTPGINFSAGDFLNFIRWYDLAFLSYCDKMSADPHGCGNNTLLPTCCKLRTTHLLHVSAYPRFGFIILNRLLLSLLV